MHNSFTAYCIRFKSYAKKKRSIVRMASLSALTIFPPTLLTKRRFRRYAFFALLRIGAILGVVAFVRKKRDTEEYQTSKLIKKTVAASLMIVIAMMPEIIFPQYQ
jgi:hypothetical protein